MTDQPLSRRLSAFGDAIAQAVVEAAAREPVEDRARLLSALEAHDYTLSIERDHVAVHILDRVILVVWSDRESRKLDA